MQTVQTDRAPSAIGPYSQGMIVNGFVFTSGQIALDPVTTQLPEGIRLQTERCCGNIKAVLEAAGSDLTKVIKTTCYLVDMSDFSAFNEIYARYFTSKPARSCVAVKQLPKGALCEIEAIATL